MKPFRTEWHNEDRIEASMRLVLKEQGWNVDDRNLQSGADIIARDPRDNLWIFEVKGYPSTFYKSDGKPKRTSTIRTQKNVWFIEALGQILCRMTDSNDKYGVVFPDHPTDPYFVKRSLALSVLLRININLWVLLLNEESHIRALAPGFNSFDKFGETFFKNAQPANKPTL